jgi:hypothetical protein
MKHVVLTLSAMSLIAGCGGRDEEEPAAAPTGGGSVEEQLQFAGADVACEEEQIVPVEDVVQAEKERAFREANTELLRRVQGAGG